MSVGKKLKLPCICGGQRMLWRNQFFLSTMRLLGWDKTQVIRLSDKSDFIHQAILTDPK